MNLDKISEERLFQNNTKEELKRWCPQLQYFHYMRSRGGHNCEGDSLCVYFKYSDREDLIKKLSLTDVTLNKLKEGFIAFAPSVSYSFDDLDKLKITIAKFGDLEQPQHVKIEGHSVHVWVLSDSFEISVSGTRPGTAYKVTEEDFQVCLTLEKLFDNLGWASILDENIKTQVHCISKDKYPELF